MENFSALAEPLNRLLGKGVPWEWTSAQDVALSTIKRITCEEGRALKRIDPERPLLLYTDWRSVGIGAVLAQIDEHKNEYMCATISRSLNKHERNYSSYKGEVMAAVWAIKSFRPHLHGVHFTLITDHQPLLWLMTTSTLTGQMARYALSIQDYTFTVIHRAGRLHTNADHLSRMPLSSQEDNTGARMDPDETSTALMSSDTDEDLVCLFTRAAMSWEILSMLRALEDESNHVSTAVSSMPTPNELCAGHCGYAADDQDMPWEDIMSYEQQELHRKAQVWLRTLPPDAGSWDDTDGRYPSHPDRLVNAVISPGHALKWLQRGVTLFEPFGGMCAGLEMCLRNGIRVNTYHYADKSPQAQRVAMHRLNSLSGLYPSLLDPGTVEQAFRFRQDVKTITDADIHAQVQSDPTALWLVVAGWECQDLSSAGQEAGLSGSRSNTYYDLMRILLTLQRMLHPEHLSYILENTAMQYNLHHDQPRNDFEELVAALGEPVCLDAARFDSYAHRLRNFWTNLVPTRRLQQLLHQATRTPGLTVQNILDSGCCASVAKVTEVHPRYPCNLPGEPLSALPTLMATVASYAFRDQGPGVIWDAAPGQNREPSPSERERAMGYDTDSTAAPGLSNRDRHIITGSCMDANCMASLLAACIGLSASQPITLDQHPTQSSSITDTAPQGELTPSVVLTTRGHPPSHTISRPGLGYTAPPRSRRAHQSSRTDNALGQPITFVHGGTLPLAPTETTIIPAQARPLLTVALMASTHTHISVALRHQAMAAIAEALEDNAEDSADGLVDIHHDFTSLHYMRHGTQPDPTNKADVRRALRRARQYLFRSGKIL